MLLTHIQGSLGLLFYSAREHSPCAAEDLARLPHQLFSQ